MRKQAYYFSHDSNARQDDKIIALRMKHGWEGYGLYWALIEKLRDSTNYMCVKDYNIIAFDLRVDASKIKSIIEDFELFKFEDKKFFSPSLISRMEIKEEFIDKSTIAGIKGSLIKHKHASRQELDSMTDSEIIALNQQVKELKGAKLSHSYSPPKATLKPPYSPPIAIKEKESKVKESISSFKKEAKEESDDLEFPEEEKEIEEPVINPDEEKEKSCAKKEKEIIDYFHKQCSTLPKVQLVNDTRKKAIKARIKDVGIEKVMHVIKMTGESSFLNGENDRGWSADFDWIMKPTNFTKILEGNYINRTNGHNQTTISGSSNKGSVSNGKVSGRAYLASKFGSQQSATDSESGNFTIDVEAI